MFVPLEKTFESATRESETTVLKPTQAGQVYRYYVCRSILERSVDWVGMRTRAAASGSRAPGAQGARPESRRFARPSRRRMCITRAARSSQHSQLLASGGAPWQLFSASTPWLLPMQHRGVGMRDCADVQVWTALACCFKLRQIRMRLSDCRTRERLQWRCPFAGKQRLQRARNCCTLPCSRGPAAQQ